MEDQSTIRLAELMQKRRKCLVQLRDLGLRQTEFVATGNTADLLRLCGAKQQLIAALQVIEVQLASFQQQLPEERAWGSNELRQRCADDADACRTLIAEVMALEQSGEQQMTARRDDLANQLRSVTSAGRVRAAYQANG